MRHLSRLILHFELELGPCVESLQSTALKSQSQIVPVSSDYRNVSVIVDQTGLGATSQGMPYSVTNVSPSSVSVRIRFQCNRSSSNASTDTGAQPLVSEDGKLTLTVNGEIYNHLSLRASLASGVKFKTHSDCEVILPLVRAVCALFILLLIYVVHQYKVHDKNVPAFLDGMFAFVLLDETVTPSRIIAARDPVGITTLYQGWSSKRPGVTYFASELKALTEECDKIISFPPGHVFDSRDNSTTRYYQPSWFSGDQENALSPATPVDYTLIRETLEAAVRKRLMSEVPYGVLLSGGLDSSLIAAIAARETEKVAQAQFEARKRKLAEATSGPPTPKWDDRNERGKAVNLFRSMPVLTDRPKSHACHLAPAPLVLDRIGKLSRPFSRKESSTFSRHNSPRIRFYRAGRTGCHSRCHLPSGDVRRDDRSGKHAHVPSQP